MTPEQAAELTRIRADGYGVLKAVFNDGDIASMRKTVLENRHLMRNTRPSPRAGHLASFHRYPVLETLHTRMTQSPVIHDCLSSLFDGRDYITIGLSDITINRSQQWHTDLLRGTYRHYLNDVACWEGDGQCYKALVYLQPGRSLRVIPGSHLRRTSLVSDAEICRSQSRAQKSVHVDQGDVIIMDIRLVHRGSTEEDIAALPEDEHKILISTVFGGCGFPLTRQMQLGNSQRLMDWENRNPCSDPLGDDGRNTGPR